MKNSKGINIPNWAKGVIAIIILLVIVYLVYRVYNYAVSKAAQIKDERQQSGNIVAQATENFSNIPLKIGAGAVISPKGDAYTVFVPADNNVKYRFDFFSNGRVWIYTSDKKIVVSKGKYFDSGQLITLDNGKTFSHASVWENMQSVLKSV